MSQIVKHTMVKVKPVMSTSPLEARSRVINLYKSWHRQIPIIKKMYDLPVTHKACAAKVREKFEENKQVTDLRTIDYLILKGQMELYETMKMHKQTCHVMTFFKDTVNEKPKDFLSKFLYGH